MSLIDFLFNRYMWDWEIISRAVLAWSAGHNPYLSGSGMWNFFNPIWTVLPLLPLALLPKTLQPIVLVILPMLVIALLGRKFNYRGFKLFLLMASPALWFCIGYGNIDWLVWLGLLLPAPVGILFLAMKPQTTVFAIAVVLLRLQPKQRLVALVPLSIGVVWWVLVGIHLPDPSTNVGNIAFWPYSLILGLPLAGLALWKKSIRLAMAAGVFCTPYITGSSILALSIASPLAGVLTYVALSFRALTK